MASLHSSLSHGFVEVFGIVSSAIDITVSLNFKIGSDTYLHPGNGSYSAIDLTVTDPSLHLDFSWKVHDDLCGSDHFPIVLESLHSTLGNYARKCADFASMFFELSP
jgi:hypothetical protein